MNATTMFRIKSLLPLCVAALFVTGCTPQTAQWNDTQTVKHNKVSFVRVAHEVHFGGAKTLSPAEAARLAEFLRRQEVAYGDRVSLVAVDGATAQLQRRAVAAALSRYGVSPTAALPTEGAAATPGVVTVVVARYVVTPPPCPDWSRKPSSDGENQTSSNFGCADAYNLGLMVADPRDLVNGHELAPADGDAATLSIQRYRDGKVTPLQSDSDSKSTPRTMTVQ